MKEKNCYKIIKHRHVTEKARVLEGLQNADSNRSVRKCALPKYVFVVDPKANKKEIKQAVEEIYSDKKIKVTDVNTVNKKPKARRVRGRKGMTSAIKKAIITLSEGDVLDDQV